MIRTATSKLSETPNQLHEHLFDDPVTPSGLNKFAGLEVQYSSQGDDLVAEIVCSGPEFESKMYTPAYAVCIHIELTKLEILILVGRA